MPHDFILQRIMISISTLSKYVTEKKNIKQKMNHLYWVVSPPGTNASCHVAGWRAHLYQVEAPPSTDVWHLYRVFRPVQMLDHICIGWFVPGFEPVQKVVFPVVMVSCYYSNLCLVQIPDCFLCSFICVVDVG
jgi:hypothetical protein